MAHPQLRTHARRRPLVAVAAVAAAVAITACGGKSFAPNTKPVSLPSGQPGKGRPAVTLGDKNFTEQFILGELYAQALRAKGYTVNLKSDIGPSEKTDGELISGKIDLYPEYTGVIVSALQNINLAGPGGAQASAKSPPRSAKQAYEQAAQYEDRRGFTMLNPTPFQDADRVATTPAFARAHDLKTMRDLAKLGTFTYGGPPENRTRYEGVRGMQQAYGLKHLRFVPYAIGTQYAALNAGKVNTIAVFTTDGRLLHGNYAVLSDPKNIFGFQNVAPVVNKGVLSKEGRAFSQTLNAVTSKLTTSAIQQMNAAVDLDHRSPAEVARSFLAANVLK
jgi:osmoprotectant transport system substrate-binding protein